MKKVYCVICPNSCEIEIDENTLEAKGNLCPRGLEFAKQEITNPKRTVTSSVKTIFKSMPVLSCRTNKPVSKDKISEVMAEINRILIDYPVRIGNVILYNIAGTDADLIATNNLEKEN